MTNHSHETASTQFVETQGIRYANRRFGKPGKVPLLFLEYFNSNMDGWDPAVTNSLATDHEVILFDNAGVAASGGETTNTVVEMTPHCVAFCPRWQPWPDQEFHSLRALCSASDPVFISSFPLLKFPNFATFPRTCFSSFRFSDFSGFPQLFLEEPI